MDCKCTNLQSLKEWQLIKLRQHIQDNEYYMGERLHHPVSWNEAEYDFFLNYAVKVGKELRVEFCSQHCSVQDCPLRQLFIDKDS